MDLRARVVELNTARTKVWEQGKALLEGAAGRELSGEERATWERIDASITNYDAEIRSLVERDTREREAGELREAHAHLFGAAAVDRQTTTESDAIRQWLRQPAHARGDLVVDIRTAARERQLLRQGASPEELRVLAWDTGSVGSTVPTTLSRTLYEYLEAGIAAFRIGATQLNTASGENLDLPTLAAHAIATQVSGQGTALAGSDPTFAKTTLGAFKYGELVVVANEVLSDSGIDIAAFLGRDMGRALARRIDSDLVVGTGSGQPQGMMTAAIVGAAGTLATGGTLATSLNIGSVVAMVYAINDEYRARGAAFLMRDATAGVIRQMRDGAGGTLGAFLWEPSLTNGLVNGQPDRLLGFPVYTDPNVASLASNARIMAFGDFSTYYMRMVGNVAIDSDTSRYFDTDQTAFRGKWRVDGDYVDLTGVVLLKNSVT